MSQVLAQMAQLLGRQAFVCDPRDEYASGFDDAGATLLRTMPDDTVTALAADGHMAIVALKREPSLDDLTLMEALKSSAFYVRVIRSRLYQSRRRQLVDRAVEALPSLGCITMQSIGDTRRERAWRRRSPARDRSRFPSASAMRCSWCQAHLWSSR